MNFVVIVRCGKLQESKFYKLNGECICVYWGVCTSESMCMGEKGESNCILAIDLASN